LEKALSRSDKEIAAAKHLIHGGFFEAAVSRAYYAMYHSAKAALSLKDIDARTHKGLIARFGLDLVGSGDVEPALGRAFAATEEEREEADYDLEVPIRREDAERAVAEAERFVAKMRERVASGGEGASRKGAGTRRAR
jgi:uncharacterized protein (UPF0332 family)